MLYLLKSFKNCDLMIRNVPVYMGTVMSIREEDKKYNQKWSICKNCGYIQLLELLPLEELYSKNHHSEVVGQIWAEHHASFARFILYNNPNNVIEIGAAHGYLATLIVNQSKEIKYAMVDGLADVVYGSRFIGSEMHRVNYFWHKVGNRFLTTLSNMFSNLSLSDMELAIRHLQVK